MIVDNLQATSIGNERIDRAARVVARAATATPTLGADAKAALRKAQEFLGCAVTAHMLGNAQAVAEDAETAEVYARGALVRSGYFKDYPVDYIDSLLADA